MKKALAVTMVLGLIFGSIATAEAGKKKPKKVEREVQGTYQAPATAACFPSQTDAIGCVAIATGPTERFFTAKATDAHGLPVAIGVEADLDGNGDTETSYGIFCGETAEPLQIDPGVELVLWIARADTIAVSRCAPGVATTGKIDVVLSNLP